YKVSVDSEIRESLGIRAIPTLIAYKNGKEVGERLVEPDAKLPIQNLLQQTLD
ncbi:MAG: thioredoxin family protein, partial [Helicobacter sp.]|nr:thioredoxin family protein [Helicobacter sp.]